MVLVSFYSAIDSWFLAQYVSTNAMAAINIVLPYSNLIWGLAVMFTWSALSWAKANAA